MSIIKLFFIIFYIGINICFGARQIVYGTYAIFNSDIPDNVAHSDTITWKYYNRDENKILEGVLIPSSKTPGVGTNGPGSFSFSFNTDEYYGALEFTIKTSYDNRKIEIDNTFMDGNNQWVQKNSKNRNSINILDGIYVEFDYAKHLKKSQGF